jgi:hypothetical protein
MFVRRFVVVLAAVVWLTGVLPAPAQETKKEGLREVVGQLAESVRKVAGKLEQPAVRVGFFTPFGLDDSHAGGAFMAELANALKDFVNPASVLELRGEYGFIENPEKSGLKVIVVRAKLIRVGTGREEKEFPEFEGHIRSVTDLARIAGGNVSFKSDDKYEGPPSEGRNKDLQKTLPPAPGKPPVVQAHIHGPGDTLVSATKDSPYSVEIRTLPLTQFGKQAAAARPIKLDNGLPFVPIDKGELFEARVLNHSDHEIAVSLALDGIDQFSFTDDRKEDGRPKFSHWIVGACQGDKPGEVLIRGWHKTAKPLTDEDKRQGKGNVLKFLVTNYGEGAASKFPTQSQGKVGTITVGVALSFPSGSGNKSASEIGFGPPEEVKQEVVKRDIGAPHEFITVRYSRIP